MKQNVDYELVGFTATLYEAGAIIHQRTIDSDAWWLLPRKTWDLRDFIEPLTGEALEKEKRWLFGTFDRLYRVKEPVISIYVRFIGNSNDSVTGGIHAAVEQGGERDVFEGWEAVLAEIVRKRCQDRNSSRSVNGLDHTVSFVTLWSYWSTDYGDDFDDDWKLIGVVEPKMIDGLVFQVLEHGT